VYRERDTHTSEAALWGLEFLEELLSVHPRRDRALPAQNRTDRSSCCMDGEEVYVDWRGNAVDERRHGGIRATLFLYGKLSQPFLNCFIDQDSSGLLYSCSMQKYCKIKLSQANLFL